MNDHRGESLAATMARVDALTPRPPPVRVIPYAEFLAGFTPPDYVIDGLFQRRYVYACTGLPGAGKTALALRMARCFGTGARFAGREVEQGAALYLCAENPDDVRMRLIGMAAQDPSPVRSLPIGFEPLRNHIPDMLGPLSAQAPPEGWIAVFVDTGPAYFPGSDENSNTEAGDHARSIRALTTLPGGPTVFALCHPRAGITDPVQLVPRGGSAFLGEIDGNVTLWKHDDDKVTFHHTGKFRGPGFEPVEFKLEQITTTALVDSKNRLIPTVQLRPISEEEAANDAERRRLDDKGVLLLACDHPDYSRAVAATKLGWINPKDEPLKMRVQRALDRLARRKLVVIDKEAGGVVTVTDAGRKEADRLRNGL